MQQFVQRLIDLIFKPGASLQLVPLINVCIVLLLVVLASLLYSKIDTIHIVVMGALAMGLLASVNWYSISWMNHFNHILFH